MLIHGLPKRSIPIAATACLAAFCILLWPARAQNQPTYPVGGVVLNSLTDQPIARVLVAGPSDALLTDSEGRFELHLPEGTTSIRLQRPGYAASESTTPFAVQMVRIASGMAPITLYLAPAASLAAHVELSTGDEPDGINFRLLSRSIVDGHVRWGQQGQASSDSQGLVRFTSLHAPGLYVLCSMAAPDQPGVSAPAAAVYGYPSTCFPGGTDFASAVASPLVLAPGQHAELEAGLTRQLFYPVSIAVAGAGQQPRPFVQVYSQDGQPMGFIPHLSTPGGTETFHLPNGSYYAEVHTGRGPGSLRYGRVDFTVAGAPLPTVTLVPLPIQPISVEIHRDFTANPNPNQQPGAGFFAEGTPPDDDGPGLNISLIPVGDSTAGQFGGNLRRNPNSPYGDLFQWDVTAQGRFWIRVYEFGSYYVSSITSGGADLARQPLVIGPGGASYPIEVTLRNDMGRLACALAPPLSSASGPNAPAGVIDRVVVSAVPLFPTVQSIPQDIGCSQEGAAYPIPFPPGDYLLVASRSRRQFDLDDPAEISRLTAEGQKVTIQPGQTTSVQVDKLMTDTPQAGASETDPAEARQ